MRVLRHVRFVHALHVHILRVDVGVLESHGFAGRHEDVRARRFDVDVIRLNHHHVRAPHGVRGSAPLRHGEGPVRDWVLAPLVALPLVRVESHRRNFKHELVVLTAVKDPRKRLQYTPGLRRVLEVGAVHDPGLPVHVRVAAAREYRVQALGRRCWARHIGRQAVLHRWARSFR